MKAFRFFVIPIISMLLLACQNNVEPLVQEEFILEISSEEYTEALGDGESFILSISSNMAWTIKAVGEDGTEIDWVIFDQIEGEGDASVFGTILKGVRNQPRKFTVVVTSLDGTREVSVEINQAAYVPVLIPITFENVIKLAASAQVGEEVACMEMSQIKGINILDDTIENNCIYLTDNNLNFIKLITEKDSEFAIGANLAVDLSGAVIYKNATGGYEIKLREAIETYSDELTEPRPAYISSTALASYEDCFVKLGDCQVAEENLSGTWSGETKMDLTADIGDFVVSVPTSSAISSIAKTNGRGKVFGIVKNGKLTPRIAEDLSQLTSSRGEKFELLAGSFAPIRCLFKGKSKTANSNTTITDGTKLTFTVDSFDEKCGTSFSNAAGIIEKVGGGTANKMTIVNATNTTAGVMMVTCFTTVQWNYEDTYMKITIPLKEPISGDIDFISSFSTASPAKYQKCTLQWSRDGSTWNDMDAIYDVEQQTVAEAKGSTFVLTKTTYQDKRQTAEFSVPESNPVRDVIYFKMVTKCSDATTTLRCNFGFVLMPRVKEIPKQTYDNYLASENFENGKYGAYPLIGEGLSFMRYFSTKPAFNAPGWTSVGTIYPLRGAICAGGATGAQYITSPALDKLTGPTDITVSFLYGKYITPTYITKDAPFEVKVEGEGTVGDIVWEDDITKDLYSFKRGSVKISGATSTTQVSLGTFAEADGEFYLDNIIIKK